jgi:hypothetical protein
MGDLSKFEGGHIAGERLVGAFVTTATLLDLSRATVSKVTSHTRIIERHHVRKEQLTKINTDGMRLSYTVKNFFFEKSQLLQHREQDNRTECSP